ncbi:MAG: hypothetical protein MI748_16465 [Opitutales bacterium]|nr:hypothetical protein [Opitutales bacterium]
MARNANDLPTKQLRLSTNPYLVKCLESLARNGHGLYGKNPTETAERLLAEKLRELIKSGELIPPNQD